MVVSTPASKLTYEDFVRFPEDGRRHEILDGEHVVTPAPFPPHQDVVLALAARLYIFLQGKNLGKIYVAPTDVRLGRHDVVEPDVFYLSRAKLALIGAKNIQGPPDLAVEVLSSSTKRIDLGTKRSRYEALGVGEYWVLDPERRTATIFRRASGAPAFEPPNQLSAEAEDVLTTPLLPELEIPLRVIFER